MATEILALWESEHVILSSDADNNQTYFDSHHGDGTPMKGSTPMSIMLQSLATCSMMDVLDIIKKKRKTTTSFSVCVTAERADEHPRVYTKAHLHYKFASPDATEHDLVRSIELSQDKYCSASAMFKRSGCEVTWTHELIVAE